MMCPEKEIAVLWASALAGSASVIEELLLSVCSFPWLPGCPFAQSGVGGVVNPHFLSI
jgi:hypothetical protein